MQELNWFVLPVAAVGAELIARAPWSRRTRVAAWLGLALAAVAASGALNPHGEQLGLNVAAAFWLSLAAVVGAVKVRLDGRPRAAALLWIAATIWFAAGAAGDPHTRISQPGFALAALLVAWAASANRDAPRRGAA